MLERHDSATRALEDWCALQGLSPPANTIRAHMCRAGATTPPEYPERHLRPDAGEGVTLRHVELTCAHHVLSIAWNWYVPERLSPDMNAQLRTSLRPFGKVIAPLGFRRETIEQSRAPFPGCPSDAIASHRSRLVGPDGRTLAYLVECYTAANLHLGRY